MNKTAIVSVYRTHQSQKKLQPYIFYIEIARELISCLEIYASVCI